MWPGFLLIGEVALLGGQLGQICRGSLDSATGFPIMVPPATAEDLIPPTRRTYDGPLAVGYDLMQVTVGETIEVHPRRVLSDK